MTRTTFIAKEADLRIEADEGSRRVTVDVAGRPAVLSVQSAERTARKLVEAARRASVPAPQ